MADGWGGGLCPRSGSFEGPDKQKDGESVLFAEKSRRTFSAQGTLDSCFDAGIPRLFACQNLVLPPAICPKESTIGTP